MSETLYTVQTHGSGKSYAQYMAFIGAVQSGKKAIAVGKGYVVLSRDAYDDLAALRTEVARLTKEREEVIEVLKETKLLLQREQVKSAWMPEGLCRGTEACPEVARLRDSLAARDRLIGEYMKRICDGCKERSCAPCQWKNLESKWIRLQLQEQGNAPGETGKEGEVAP